MNATVSPDLGEWLMKKRAGRPLVDFAQELGVSKSALQRYESGENKLPSSLVVTLQERFPDFPIAGGATYKRIEAGVRDFRVAEERAPYGERVHLEAYERTLKVMVTAQELVSKVFASQGLSLDAHNDLYQLLVTLMMRDDVTGAGAMDFVRWYAYKTRADRSRGG